MTETPVQPAVCPLPLDVLPGNFQKHVDPKMPVALRMRGAKALVPMGPTNIATALFILTFDRDATVRETAVKTAAALADRILSVALRDESADPKVLGYYACALQERPEYLEMLALNPSTPDETVALIARAPHEELTEVISQNQLRMLRHEPIVRALVTNPATRPLTADNVTDFCVRSGLVLADLPAFAAARKRVLGSGVDEAAALAAAATAQAEEAAAEQALLEMGASDAATEMIAETPEQEAAAERKRLTIALKVSKLSIAKKIEWANKKGNKEVRTILLRDPSEVVQLAVIQSPRITEGEIAKVAICRTAPSEALQYIYNNRRLTKNYAIKVNLVNNPKVPLAVSMRFRAFLRWKDKR